MERSIILKEVIHADGKIETRKILWIKI